MYCYYFQNTLGPEGICGAHGVVASHPLCMRKALGSNPSVSKTKPLQVKLVEKEKQGCCCIDRQQATLTNTGVCLTITEPTKDMFSNNNKGFFFGITSVAIHTHWVTCRCHPIVLSNLPPCRIGADGVRDCQCSATDQATLLSRLGLRSGKLCRHSKKTS